MTGMQISGPDGRDSGSTVHERRTFKTPHCVSGFQGWEAGCQLQLPNRDMEAGPGQQSRVLTPLVSMSPHVNSLHINIHNHTRQAD